MKESEITLAEPVDTLVEPFRLFNRFWDDFFTRPTTNRVVRPAVDVSETESSILISVELPGMKKEDVKITVENGILTVSGERNFEKETKDKTFHRIERSYGTFHRALTLPTGVDVNAVKAKMEHGILVIEFPKMEEAKPKTIKIV